MIDESIKAWTVADCASKPLFTVWAASYELALTQLAKCKVNGVKIEPPETPTGVWDVAVIPAQRTEFCCLWRFNPIMESSDNAHVVTVVAGVAKRHHGEFQHWVMTHHPQDLFWWEDLDIHQVRDFKERGLIR